MTTAHPSRRRRFLTGAAVLSIAVVGAAWGGCGDDTEAQESADQALEDTGKEAEQAQEEADQAAEDAGPDGGGGTGY